MDPQQRIIQFEGQVQGVGFRYTAVRLAQQFDVTGYVCNLPDGRVECLVEGDAAEIDRFVEQLSQRMRPYIGRQTQQVCPASGTFRDFGVKY
jgi:acylphosphatase